MIVYPAYVYMGKEPPVPDFPFWENGSLKVSMADSFKATFSPAENRVVVNDGHATFTVDASQYSKIKFNANSFTTIQILVYATENRQAFGTTSYFVESTKKDFEFVIPEAFKKSGAQFEFQASNSTLYLNSVVLTN